MSLAKSVLRTRTGNTLPAAVSVDSSTWALTYNQHSAFLGHGHIFASIQKVLKYTSSKMHVIYLSFKRADNVQNFNQAAEMWQPRKDSQWEPRSFEVSIPA